ncbi:hypothetical protein HYR99_30715 [Candidatus Poribacteria bacterium]|nr:hypothetical protein [Candidatus Poribacteria bacterium]
MSGVRLRSVGSTYGILFSNKSGAANPGPVVEKPAGGVAIHEIDGTVTRGPIRAVRVELQPMEIQIWGGTR